MGSETPLCFHTPSGEDFLCLSLTFLSFAPYPQVPQVIVEVYMKQNFSFFFCVH